MLMAPVRMHLPKPSSASLITHLFAKNWDARESDACRPSWHGSIRGRVLSMYTNDYKKDGVAQRARSARKERALVFDVGGTFMRAAEVDMKSGLLLVSDSVRTPNFLSNGKLDAFGLIDAVVQSMHELGARVLDGALP